MIAEGQSEKKVQIAIVVPLYRQSTLAYEALSSVLSQRHGRSVSIVIVDDGCPNLQSVALGCGLSAAFENVYYLRQKNRGLSGARNRGIEFVLENLPACVAIFFLDSDNVLTSFALESFYRALESHPNFDWFYPNITYFGLEYQNDNSGPYSLSTHLFMNICEAGSLVRRRVFEAGVRFDERMRLGYEDWDFWLSAAERGFRGYHLAEAGFRYRKRPESMISSSVRNDAEIRQYMQTKHRWTQNPMDVVALEHCEAPRFAIVLIDRGVVRLTSDPTVPGIEMSIGEFEELFWKNFASPNVYKIGAFLVVTTDAAMRLLQEYRLKRWTFWDLETQLDPVNFAALDIVQGDDDVIETSISAGNATNNMMVILSRLQTIRDVCIDENDTWIRNILVDTKSCRIHERKLVLPVSNQRRRLHNRMLYEFVNICLRLRTYPYSRRFASRAGDRVLGTPDKAHIPFRLRESFGNAPLPPIMSRGCRVAFVLPMLDFGGVEKVSLKVARELKKLGFIPCLVLLKRRQIRMPDQVSSIFDDIYIVDQDEFENWDAPRYQGTHLPRWSIDGAQASVANLLSSFDVVLSCHAADVLGTFGLLRKRGIVTASYLHLFDRPHDQLVGHPMIAIAFEHVIDIFIACSHDLSNQLRALAVPAEKIVTVPNAAGCDIDQTQVDAIMAERQSREDVGPLRVLYIGRLDSQKGVDRLAEIIQCFLGKSDQIEFRVVGKHIVDKDTSRELDAYLEPPVYSDVDLMALYAWADLLIMPSRYEGSPLTIIEAMSYGAVPLVTDVGAVSELVDNGVNGVLVSQDSVVEDMLKAIDKFMSDRAMLRSFSKKAAESAAGRNWNDAVKNLACAIEMLKAKPNVPESVPRVPNVSFINVAMPLN